MKYVVKFASGTYLDDDGYACGDALSGAQRFDSVEEAWMEIASCCLFDKGAKVLRLKPKAPRVPVMYLNFCKGHVTGGWSNKEDAVRGAKWADADELAVPVYR